MALRNRRREVGSVLYEPLPAGIVSAAEWLDARDVGAPASVSAGCDAAPAQCPPATMAAAGKSSVSREPRVVTKTFADCVVVFKAVDLIRDGRTDLAVRLALYLRSTGYPGADELLRSCERRMGVRRWLRW